LEKVSFVELPKRAFKFRAFTILQILSWRMVYNNISCYCMFIINSFDLKVSNVRTIDWSHVQIDFNKTLGMCFENYQRIQLWKYMKFILLTMFLAFINNPSLTLILVFMASFIHLASLNSFYTILVVVHWL
jgi:hypothetical protein